MTDNANLQTTLVRWEDLQAIPRLEDPRMCSWLGPLDRAKSLGLTLYTDDVALMAVARDLGVPHFGSAAVLQVLDADAHWTDSAVEEAWDVLTSSYCVDWPGQLESVRRVAEKQSWEPGPASFALTRPNVWSAPGKAIAVISEILNNVKDDDNRTFSWFATASTGLAWLLVPTELRKRLLR